MMAFPIHKMVKKLLQIIQGSKLQIIESLIGDFLSIIQKKKLLQFSLLLWKKKKLRKISSSAIIGKLSIYSKNACY